MNIEEKRDGEVITLKIEGRVDTNTSPELQNKLLLAFQKVKNVVLDFSGCEYVSSAGLRAMLIGQKTAQSKGGSLKLIKVPDVIVSVLETTGFLSFLTIE